MTEFVISEISNGWILCGPENPKEHIIGGPEKELFLPTMHAVADIIETWEMAGFTKAATLADKKYNFVGR